MIPPTILCIDDSDSILECLDVLLSMDGYRVLTALGGAEGLGILETDSVDAIVLDCNMPEMSGIDVAVQIRERGLKIPIIMFAGEDHVPEEVAIIVNAFVPKAQPHSFTLITSLLDSLALRVREEMPATVRTGGSGLVTSRLQNDAVEARHTHQVSMNHAGVAKRIA